MSPVYGSYAIVRVCPDSARGEHLNIGLAVWDGDRCEARFDEQALQRATTCAEDFDRGALDDLLSQFTAALAEDGAEVIDTAPHSAWGPLSLSETRSCTLDDGPAPFTGPFERLTRRLIAPDRQPAT